MFLMYICCIQYLRNFPIVFEVSGWVGVWLLLLTPHEMLDEPLTCVYHGCCDTYVAYSCNKTIRGHVTFPCNANGPLKEGLAQKKIVSYAEV